MIAFARTAAAAFALATLGLAAAPAAAQRDGEDRRILIENRSGQTITYVRGSPTTDTEFGRDRIPSRVLGHGERAVVDFDNGTRHCMYDLRATLADGRNVDRMNVNVCRLSRWTIGRGTNRIR